MTTKKILYVVSTLKSSGPINVLFNLVKYLNRDKFEPLILTLSPESQNSSWSSFQKLGVQINSLNLSRLQGFLSGKSALNTFVEKLCPDVIHTHGIRADMLSAKCLKKYQRVTTIHNYPYDDYIMKYGKLRGNYMAWKHLQAFRQIDFPVAISDSLAKMVQTHGLKSKTIRNGVDLSLYAPISHKERLALRQKLGLSETQKVFVLVGSLIARKDPQTVIRGFLNSKAKDRGLLLLIGEGFLKKECQSMCQEEDGVRFIGQVSNVADYLKAADYLISGSLSEGLGYAVLEGLACGLPICVSEIEPHQEIISFNQKAGLLFPASNPDALANKINQLIGDRDIQARAKAGKEIVSNYFNAKTMSEEYQNLYNQIIN